MTKKEEETGGQRREPLKRMDEGSTEARHEIQQG